MEYLRNRHYFVSTMTQKNTCEIGFSALRIESNLKGKELFDYIVSESQRLNPGCAILSITKLD